MTPLQLDMLIHYHSRPFEYHKVESNNTRYEQAMNLVSEGLLYDNLVSDKDSGTRFSITDKGEAHLLQILSVPLPKACFLMADGSIKEVSNVRR